MENDKKQEVEKAVAPPKKEATVVKYLVIKNFTGDKQYYRGNEFFSTDKKLIAELLTAKLIK
jgi:hypothetical protein